MKDFSLRLIAIFVVITLSSSLTLNYYFFNQARGELKSELMSRGQSLTRMLADMSRVGVFAGNEQDLQEPASIVYREPNCTKVHIYDSEGASLLSLSDGQNSESKKYPSRNLIEQLTGSTDESLIIDNSQFSEIIFGKTIFAGPDLTAEELFLSPIAAEANFHSDAELQPIGYVEIILSSKELEEDARQILARNLAVSLVIVFISSLCIYFIVRNMTRPLKSLAKAIMKHKSSGPDSSNPELLNDFGEMVDIIQQSYQEISVLKENLEEKVRYRTVELSESNTALAQQKIALERVNSQLKDTIEELQQTRDQLIQSEKMAALGQLLGGLSHEINNALNFITGALPRLDRNLQSMEKQGVSGDLIPDEQEKQKRSEQNRTLFDNIMEGVWRITELTQNLRVFGYTNPENFSKEDIRPGLSACIGIVRSRYGKQIVIREEFAPNLPKISCNMGQLNQVFMNLLLNAAQSIKEQGTITLKTYRDDNQLHVAVSDTGEGIPAEKLGKVFNPFYTTKKMGEGTGLGLSISYTIIKKHGGTIDVYSKPGEGSIFEISLPI